MRLEDYVEKYNKSEKENLEDLLHDLTAFFGYPSNRGVCNYFSKEIKSKNSYLKPIDLIVGNSEIYFNVNGYPIFKIIAQQYNPYDVPCSCLRTSVLNCPNEQNYLFNFVDGKYQMGKSGIYEDLSKKGDMSSYRYVSINTHSDILYESIVDFNKGRISKDVYKHGEVDSRFYYSFTKKAVSENDYLSAAERIDKFLSREFPKMLQMDRERTACDLVDQFFYDIRLMEKDTKFDDIYVHNNSKSYKEFDNSFYMDGLSIKGIENLNKESYLVMRNPYYSDLKLICVTDFVNGIYLGDETNSYVVNRLENWFASLDPKIYEKDNRILKSFAKELTDINYNLHQFSSKCKKDRYYKEKVVGSAIGLALITKYFTYFLNYGDTRIYAMADNEVFPLTTDNTTVWDKYVDGVISREVAFEKQKGAKLTDYLGNPKTYTEFPRLMKVSNDLYDKLFIFTDGVTDNVDDNTLNYVLNTTNDSESLRKIVFTSSKVQDKRDDVTGVCYIKKKMDKSLTIIDNNN